jgi:hypothetical protein
MKRQISSRELWKKATNDDKTYSHRPNASIHFKAISCDAISEERHITSPFFTLE